MEVKTFGVIGAGQMGNGIAQVAAASGLNVIMNDITEEFVQRGYKSIEKFLSKSVEKGKLPEQEKDAILGRIKLSTDIKGHGRGRLCGGSGRGARRPQVPDFQKPR